ncbi:MAG: Rieske (2Fe-2S) protein [Rhizomicrobium sp.]
MNIRWPSKFNEIPKEVFHREDVYRLELERIFMGPEWHMVAHRAELANPGDYKTFQIGEAPVLIVHGEDGKLRVFQNACPHRGTQLATCPRGSGRKIECPYHR